MKLNYTNREIYRLQHLCRKVQESKDELQSFVKQFVAGRIEENSAEVDTKLRHIERDVLRKSSKEIKASLDHVDSQMRAKRDDINSQMEQVAISITDDKVLQRLYFFGAPI